MYDHLNYEDQETDELVYGRCKRCYQIEELNFEDLCLVCEGQCQIKGKDWVPAYVLPKEDQNG